MSDHEFENYLALLASMLRLDGKQRDSIAKELRSHMEDRLEELIDQGASKEDAVRQALAEFGDAAGLAGQFVAISTNRKRRWLMRLTTFSVAATLLFAAGLAIFWPGRNAAPGVARLEAQAPAANNDPFGAPAAAPVPPTGTADAKKANPKSRKTAGSVIDEQLNKTTTVDVVEMPLRDVVQYISDTHQFPIVLKLKQLEEASVPSDTPITKCLRGIRLATALKLILDDLELTYYIDEVMVITTPADAQLHPEIRIYDCRDILTMPAPGWAPLADGNASATKSGETPQAPRGFGSRVNDHDRRAEQLMNIITTNVDQQSWSNSSIRPPGIGSISAFNGLIVVTQTAQIHNKVEHILDMLREAAGLEVPKTGKVVR